MTKPEIAKWADTAVEEGRRVRVIDLQSKTKNFNPIPFFVTAIEDIDQRKLILGSEANGAESGKFKSRKEAIFKEATKMILRGEDLNGKDEEISAQFPIMHLQMFDLKVERDAALFYLLIANTEVFAPSKMDVNPQTHRFYFEDKRRDSEQKRQVVSTKMDAFAKIRKMHQDDLEGIFRLALGYAPTDLSAGDVLAEVEVFADENPKIIVGILADPKLEAKILAMHLLNANLITYQRFTGAYFDGDSKIAGSLDALVDYISDANNSQLVTSWGKKLKKGLAAEVE